MSRNSRRSRPIDSECTVSLAFIQRELGRQTYGPTRLIRYVRLLIDDFGFPPPLPEMVADRLVTEVTEHSVWRRAPVEAWIDDWLPPANAAALDAKAQAAAAEAMDSAAAGLRLVGG